MNWKVEAVKDLKSHTQRLSAVESLKTRILVLEEQFTSLRGISTGEPVMGGMSRQEEKWLNNIAERQRLGFSLKVVESLVKLTQVGLDALNDTEYRVLEVLYIRRDDYQNHVEKLCSELNFEKTRVYEIKDEALRKFTISLYGVVEI